MGAPVGAVESIASRAGDERQQDAAAFGYRKDIAGLRALSVVAVLMYHIGVLPNGYLGVDIFFVISGFVITGVVKSEVDRGSFTFAGFYERRARRILPLSLFVAGAALAMGMTVMLPDDLENLAQSVVATNVFANNILQAITTKNYWNVVNEYKPLLHTWSLGVEEQFYLFWPVLLLVLIKLGERAAIACVAILGALSLALYLLPFPDHVRFFYLPFRTFELAAGGLVALVVARKNVGLPHAYIAVVPLMLVLAIGQGLDATLSTLLVVVFSCLLMLSDRPSGSLYRRLIENRVALYVGAISFGLYMWHQPVFAFARYAYFAEIGPREASLLIGITFALAHLSFRLVEQPFRNGKASSRQDLVFLVTVLFFATTMLGAWVHFKGGVLRDVAELDISHREAGAGMHSKYNDRIRALDREFESGKTRVLVVGDSFARDWANVLLESHFADSIEVSYVHDWTDAPAIASRMGAADVVFLAGSATGFATRLGERSKRSYIVGPKNFGKSAGIFYNYRGADYYLQRTAPDPAVVAINLTLRNAFKYRYIDLMAPVAQADGTVPVFTPAGKLISQDCRHFTRAGAKFYASIIHDRIGEALGLAREHVR